MGTRITHKDCEQAGISANAIVSGDRFWWHERIRQELDYQKRYGADGANVHALASNAGFMRADTARYVDEMVKWGELEDCEPLFEYEARWVRLAPQGKDDGGDVTFPRLDQGTTCPGRD